MLLDEPFSGIDPIAVYESAEDCAPAEGARAGILVTDHNVRSTLKLIDRGYIIHKGQVLWRVVRISGERPEGARNLPGTGIQPVNMQHQIVTVEQFYQEHTTLQMRLGGGERRLEARQFRDAEP